MLTAPAPLPDPTYVVIDGVPVATYRLDPGGPAGSDVVLCHGTPWSARVWAGVARDLSRGHRVHLWDMPGYGRSPVPAEVVIDLPAQMARLTALVAHWSLDRPVVVAHDVGGAVALGAHLLHGVDYARLALWDVVTLDPWGSPFFRLVAEHEAVFAALPATLHAALVRAYVAGAAATPLPEVWLDALVEPWLGEGGQAAFYRQIGRLRPADTRPVADRLGEVRCEVLVGWGEADPWLPVDQADALRRLLPGERPVVRLPGRGHLTPVEDPEGLLRALEDWLG